MMRVKSLTRILPIGCLALGSCVSGDFCEVVRAPITFQPETAAMVVRTDRASAEAIDVQNGYGRGHCGW